MIRSFALLFAFSSSRGSAPGSADTVLAANAILMNFFLIGGYFLDGLANAAEQLAGRAVGAGPPARVRGGGAPHGDLGLRLLPPSSRRAASARRDGHRHHDTGRRCGPSRPYLIWAALTPLAGVLAFEDGRVYIGATWSREMRNMMLASLVVFLIVLAVATPDAREPRPVGSRFSHSSARAGSPSPPASRRSRRAPSLDDPMTDFALDPALPPTPSARRPPAQPSPPDERRDLSLARARSPARPRSSS